ncbi:DUF4363 family protein [Clostridium sp. LBM24168]
MFIIMAICMIFSVNYLKSTAYKLEYSNNEIERALKTNSFQTAADSLNKFKSVWNSHSQNISIFTNHSELDDINAQIEKLTQYIDYGNKEEALISTNIIRNILESITKMENLNIQNLF